MKINKEKSKILSSNLFPVVGIGASAGGLEAFKKLIKAIPENSGMAYVLVQHLDPTHESLYPTFCKKLPLSRYWKLRMISKCSLIIFISSPATKCYWLTTAFFNSARALKK